MNRLLKNDHVTFSCIHIANLAHWALREEVQLTPKPGLVDCANNGAHSDLSVDLMLLSAQTLTPYFTEMSAVAWESSTDTLLRENLGKIGRDAESSMLLATNQINTHRGAIWALGLLCAAAAQNNKQVDAISICNRAGAIARLNDKYIPITFSKGKVASLRYKITGAKEEAQLGFPSIIKLALPTLRKSRADGDDEKTARLNTLLTLMANIDDTCILSRGGEYALSSMRNTCQHILDEGGAKSENGISAILKLDLRMIEENISPGGAADLLAATLFIDALENNLNSRVSYAAN